MRSRLTQLLNRLTQLLNAVLNSGRIAHATMLLLLLAFIIWFNYGTLLDRAISGTPQTEPLVTSRPDAMGRPPAIETYDSDYLGETIVSDATVSSVPATRSVGDQMQKIDRDATVARIEKLANDTAQLDLDLKAWNNSTSDLATNDSGRRLASDPEIFLAVVGLIQSEHVTADDFALLKSRVRVLEDEALTVREGRSSSGLDEAVTTTKAMFEKMRKSLDRATLSLSSFEKRSQLLKPSPSTLGDAIASDEEKRAADLSSQIAKDKEETKKKIADEAIKAAAAVNKLKLELELTRIAKEKADIQGGIDKGRADAKTEAAKRQLEAEFARDLPQIQHYLGKFFADGYTQRQSATHYEQRSTMGPVSLAAIQKAGALSNIVEGLDGAYPRFLHLMSSPTNDRAVQSPYPRFIGGHVPPESAATVRQGYTLLKKYQYLLVEKGYLAP